jgi:4'-phosphopantetheinyl transferase
MDSRDWPLVDRAPPLAADVVHVWQAALDVDEQVEARFASLLAPDEQQRAERFHFPRDRRRYTVARACLRVLLADYLSTSPSAVSLATTPLGKPHLSESGSSGLHFNLAHSDELALFAFSHQREVGVDLERERDDVDMHELAGRFFAPPEIAALREVAPTELRSAFFRTWTQKEAYVKALGLGMQVPLDGFAVAVTGTPKLVHTLHDPAQRDRWTLADLSPAPGYAAAIAVEGHGWRLLSGRRALFS